jgi:hypothetical protein
MFIPRLSKDIEESQSVSQSFRDWISSFGKSFQTTVFQNVGYRRQDFLDRLTDELVKIDFKPIDKESLRFTESVIFKGVDSLFTMPKGINQAVGIRAISIKDKLKVGFILGGMTTVKFYATMIISIFGGLFIGLFPIFVFDPNSEIAMWSFIFIGLPLFILIGISPSFYIRHQRKQYREKIKELMVKIILDMDGKQLAPFQKSTIDLDV